MIWRPTVVKSPGLGPGSHSSENKDCPFLVREKYKLLNCVRLFNQSQEIYSLLVCSRRVTRVFRQICEKYNDTKVCSDPTCRE